VQAADVRRRHRGESGAVLIMTAIMLVVFLGVAALVVDLGGAYANRRKMQNSADSAAVGAAQELAGANTTNAVAQAKSIGNENLPNTTLDWNACGAFPTPSPFTAVPGSNCISFSAGFEQIRVRVPKQTFATLFGKILGRSSTSTSTLAIAKVQGVGNGGGLFPFAVGGSFGNGDYCLDSGGGGNSEIPCDGPTTGNFGLLDFRDCTTNQTLGDNVAVGADHIYLANPGLPYLPDVADDCILPGPNTVAAAQGNTVGQETPALLTGSGPYPNPDGGPARLQRVPTQCNNFAPAWEVVSAACGGQGAIDNRPLWEFIPLGLGADVPISCHRETFDAQLALIAVAPANTQRLVMHALLKQCITDYVQSGSTAPVFTANTGNVVDQGLPLYDIQSSPRFVYVPQVREVTPLPGNSGTYRIRMFRSAFIQRTGANNSPNFFEPGPWNGSSLPDNSTANVGGFVLPAPHPTGCVPTPTDSCGTMLPGMLGSIGTVPIVVGANAVIELVG
jgi:hypothetical protein